MSGCSQVVRAVYRNDFADLEELLKSEDVNCRDADGTTPLMHAILADPPSLQMIEYLLEQGADVNAADSGERWTPLHFAARDQNAAIVKLLLASGAAVDATEARGNTPLSRCVDSTHPTNFEVIDLLMAYGADPGRKNLYGLSPIDLASRREDSKALKHLVS
jgi:ankyrin repeat protein